LHERFAGLIGENQSMVVHFGDGFLVDSFENRSSRRLTELRVHRAKNGGISLTDGYLNFSIHTNKIDGKPSGFNHFGFLVEDNEEFVKRFEKHGYRVPLKRPGDRHYAEFRAIDPDGNNFDLTTNGFDEMRPDARVTEFGKE